jgi:hypothetical protein
VLGLPIVAAAGARWIYCGGATALIGKILENGTKQSCLTMRVTVLFDPLGIGPTVWRIGPNGERNFASGIGMRPAIWRVSGRWSSSEARRRAADRSADWLEESFKPQVTIRDRREYGCHWNLGEMVFNSADGPRQERWIAAFGKWWPKALCLSTARFAGRHHSRQLTIVATRECRPIGC